MKRFVLAVLILALSSCVQATASEEPTIITLPSATMTDRPTLTASPSPTSRPTRTPGPSPTPWPTPSFEQTGIGDDFLFGAQTDDCMLPCWHGLIPGQSTTEDIERVFNNELGFEGGFVAYTQPSSSTPLSIISQRWDLPLESDQIEVGFGFVAYVNTQRVVEAIAIDSDSSRFRPFTNLHHVLRTLGTPNMILGEIIPAAPDYSTLYLLVIYEEGIMFPYNIALPLTQTQPNRESATFCLNDYVWNPEKPEWYLVRVFLTKPLRNGLNDLDEFQKHVIRDIAKDQSFEDLFGITPEELTQLAVEQDNPCIQTIID